MVVNDLKFFTNEPERDLYSRFSKILNTNTQFFDILVGYFRTSGFFRLYPAMESVEKIRILVGLNVDKYTIDIIDQAEKITLKEAREEFSKEIEGEFEKSETSAEIENGVRKFIEWLKSGKLEMRMYVEAPMHAKVYIMRKDPTKADYFGSDDIKISDLKFVKVKGKMKMIEGDKTYSRDYNKKYIVGKYNGEYKIYRIVD